MGLKKFFRGIQPKTVGSLALALLVIMGSMVLINIISAQKNTARELTLSTGMLVSSVYNGILHPMSINDQETIRRQMEAYGKNLADVDVIVFGFDKKITFASRPNLIGKDLTILLSPRQQTILRNFLRTTQPPPRGMTETIGQTRYFSVFRPMLNEKRCHHCHGASRKVLGGMFVRRDMTKTVAMQTRLRWLNILVGAAGILLAVALVFVLIRTQVVTPLKRLVSVANCLARGDMTRRLNLRKQDELGWLAASIDEVSRSLNQVLSDVESKSDELARGSSEQAAAVEETAASTEEIASMLNTNAKNSTASQELVESTTQVLSQARESMRQLSEYMTQTSQSSDDASKIIKSIDEIAFQTNLLALNAAVEAARAGEAGAGFAVVADEVRNLAGRAAEAAKQTSRLIHDIVGKIKQSHDLMNQADSEYREVALKVRQVAGLSSEITDASHEQAQGVEQVNAAMGRIDSVTQQQARMAAELAEAMGKFRLVRQGSTREQPTIDCSQADSPPRLPAPPDEPGPDHQADPDTGEF